MLYDQIKTLLESSADFNEDIRARFLKRLDEGALTRDENNESHFCIYFLPYDPATNKVFIIHHKKSGLWLSPGGHIDKEEGLLDALNREISEELGITRMFTKAPAPFLITITPIKNKNHPCKTHYDIWYSVQTDGSDFNLDPREFLDARWLSVTDAQKIVTDPPNKLALELV